MPRRLASPALDPARSRPRRRRAVDVVDDRRAAHRRVRRHGRAGAPVLRGHRRLGRRHRPLASSRSPPPREIVAGATRMRDDVSAVFAVAEESSATTEQVSASTEQTASSTPADRGLGPGAARTAEALQRLVGRFTLRVTEGGRLAAMPRMAWLRDVPHLWRREPMLTGPLAARSTPALAATPCSCSCCRERCHARALVRRAGRRASSTGF